MPKKTYTCVVERSEELVITLPPEIVKKYKLQPGTEVRFKEVDGGFSMEFLTETIALDLDDTTLALIARAANIRNVTINEYILCALEESVAKTTVKENVRRISPA